MNNRVIHGKRAAYNESEGESDPPVWSSHKAEPLPLGLSSLMSSYHLKMSMGMVCTVIFRVLLQKKKLNEYSMLLLEREKSIVTPPITRKGWGHRCKHGEGSCALSPSSSVLVN